MEATDSELDLSWLSSLSRFSSESESDSADCAANSASVDDGGESISIHTLNNAHFLHVSLSLTPPRPAPSGLGMRLASILCAHVHGFMLILMPIILE